MKNGKKYWVLTGAGFLKHQHYFTGKDKNKHPRVRARCLWIFFVTLVSSTIQNTDPNRTDLTTTTHSRNMVVYVYIYMYMDMDVFCKVSKYHRTIRLVGLGGDADHVYIYINIIAV